jgi:hypothetical protein
VAEAEPQQKAPIHASEAVQLRPRSLRATFLPDEFDRPRNVEAVFVWRYKPPFGALQFAYQRGRAELGQRSQQGNTYFVKLSHVF